MSQHQQRMSETSTVCIAHETGISAPALLERALEQAGFWVHIAATRRRFGNGTPFQVIIKPDLGFYDVSISDGTDPELVEHLIELLHERDYRDVVIGDGRNAPEDWLLNREPLVLPELVGYRFATPKGRPYDCVDLRELPLTEPTSDENAARVPISRHWLDAAYRISFAKNRTHEDCVFALGVHNLAGVVAPIDTRGRVWRHCPAEDCLAVLRRAPPQFTLIDAYTSCHGKAGHRAPQRLDTRVIIASSHALLADWVGAAKMGVDPYASPVNAAALRAFGLPSNHTVVGDIAPYPLWRNVHPLIAHTARLRNRKGELGRIAPSWFQRVDRERFPLRDFYNDRLNAAIAPLMAEVDSNPRAFWLILVINWLVAWLDQLVLVHRTLFAKNQVQRRVAPLVIDPTAFARNAYEAIPGYLKPHEQLLDGFPSNRDGVCWRHLDGSILFRCAQVLPIDFDDFTRTVEIRRAIQYMNDYLGGATLAVARDTRGRVVRQIERNIYLQQPNWAAALGNDEIDVEKLELIRYGKDCQTIYWRTVASPNGSATHDDGRVSFVRSGKGQTTVSIFARQQFRLPALFTVLDVDLAPGVRDPLIDRAYSAFFIGTMANLQAAHEGREFRIGHEPPTASHQADEAALPASLPRQMATALVAGLELLKHRSGLLDLTQWLTDTRVVPTTAQDTRVIDEQGFTHVMGGRSQEADVDRGTIEALSGLAALVRDAPDVLTGLANAMHDDLERLAASVSDGGSP